MVTRKYPHYFEPLPGAMQHLAMRKKSLLITFKIIFKSLVLIQSLQI